MTKLGTTRWNVDRCRSSPPRPVAQTAGRSRAPAPETGPARTSRHHGSSAAPPRGARRSSGSRSRLASCTGLGPPARGASLRGRSRIQPDLVRVFLDRVAGVMSIVTALGNESKRAPLSSAGAPPRDSACPPVLRCRGAKHLVSGHTRQLRDVDSHRRHARTVSEDPRRRLRERCRGRLRPRARAPAIIRSVVVAARAAPSAAPCPRHAN